MNYEQLTGIVRQVLPFIGGVAVAFGWLSTEQLGVLATNIAAAIGPLIVIGSTVWSIVNKTNKNIVASAAALPEVKAVITTSTVAGKEMAAAIPGPTVVAAGTAGAQAAAAAAKAK